jgi:predicted RNA-binding protein with PIN domain
MANLLIDGYNLIGIGHNNLEKARNDIIEKLSLYAKLKSHEVTIVFDAWKAGQSVENRTKSGRVTVIYSRIAEKADQVIIRMIGKHDKAWIVISTDREILNMTTLMMTVTCHIRLRVTHGSFPKKIKKGYRH